MAEFKPANGDAFAAFVKKSEEEEKERSQFSGPGSKGNFTYETQEWVGLEQGDPHIVRFVGLPPKESASDVRGPTDAHEIFIEDIKDDKGNRMQLRLPKHAADWQDEHIMWRIIAEVKKVDWMDDPEKPGKRKKYFKYENLPVFDKITHSGYSATDPKEVNSYNYAKGWGGQLVTIMNVIDREDDWCKTNKHTKLLSKKVTYSKDGVAYPTVGVPSYGFLNSISKLVKVYGSWETYDIQVTKTGQMNSPYEFKNASYYKSKGVPEIDQSKLNFVSLEPGLTAEELQYDRYNIEKFYAPTSYKNIKNRLGQTIKEVDATLHTNFYDELTSLADKEEKDRAKAREEAAASNPEVGPAPVFVSGTEPSVAPVQPSAYVDPVAPTATEQVVTNTAGVVSTSPVEPTQPTVMPTQAAPIVEARVTPAPVAEEAPARRSVIPPALSPEKKAALKGWNTLTEAEKGQISDVSLNGDSVISITYAPGAAKLLRCNSCDIPSPSDFGCCPACGMTF